jgi:hypothetical protein
VKKLAIALVATLFTSSAFAASVTIRTDDGMRRHGPTVVQSRVVRHDNGLHRGWGNQDRVVVRHRRVETTGSVGCSTRTVRRTDGMGHSVTKRISSC